jgi:hypothetical protein
MWALLVLSDLATIVVRYENERAEGKQAGKQDRRLILKTRKLLEGERAVASSVNSAGIVFRKTRSGRIMRTAGWPTRLINTISANSVPNHIIDAKSDRGRAVSIHIVFDVV